jgi:hypothetical protein
VDEVRPFGGRGRGEEQGGERREHDDGAAQEW